MNLSLIPVIANHVGGKYEGKSAYEMSSYGATFNYLRRNVQNFHFSEYFPGRPLGVECNGVRNEDATQLTYPNNSFDIVTSNQVFEHVPDDMQAYRECFRVLKPRGALIFTVPLYDSERTQRLARLSDAGEIEWLGTPEYHDSRFGGPGSAPVFWRHSVKDIAQRVAAVGFRSSTVVHISILDCQQISQPVVYAVK